MNAGMHASDMTIKAETCDEMVVMLAGPHACNRHAQADGAAGQCRLAIACYLVFEGCHGNPAAVTALVRRKRPGALQTRQQERFVYIFACYLQHLRCVPGTKPFLNQRLLSLLAMRLQPGIQGPSKIMPLHAACSHLRCAPGPDPGSGRCACSASRAIMHQSSLDVIALHGSADELWWSTCVWQPISQDLNVLRQVCAGPARPQPRFPGRTRRQGAAAASYG